MTHKAPHRPARFRRRADAAPRGRCCASDPRLTDVARRAGPFEIRLTPGGVCRAGAGDLRAAAFGRQRAAPSGRGSSSCEGALEPVRYLTLDEAAVRGVGFSACKYRTVRVIAEAVVGRLAGFRPCSRHCRRTRRGDYLVALKGIGPWTAEIYLMFCLGHPDIFPSGDLALQKAVGHALGMDSAAERQGPDRASPRAGRRIGTAAALLFWRYYASVCARARGIAL